MIQRRKVIIGTVGMAAAAAAAGCSSSGTAGGATDWVEPAADVEQVPVRLSVTPANGDADWSPVKPIVVSAADGKLQSVTVTAGKAKIDGAIQDDGTWRSTEDL